MHPPIHHNLNTLRTLLERLARYDDESHENAGEDVRAVAYSFRDCRLELIRLGEVQLSDDQLYLLLQLDYRLDMVITGHGVNEGIASAAKRVLASFRWSTAT